MTPSLAQAAALMHVSTTEQWLREHVEPTGGVRSDITDVQRCLPSPSPIAPWPTA